MDYVRAIASTIFLSIPFVFVLDMAFSVLQIPFAIIHRYAVRLFYVYKMYLLSQFYAMLARHYSESQGLSPFVMLIVNSLIILFVVSLEISDIEAGDYETGADNGAFAAVASLCSIPAFWLVYYLDVTFLNQPVVWFAKLFVLACEIPILGNVLSFFARASIAWVLLLPLIVVVAIIKLIGWISDRR